MMYKAGVLAFLEKNGSYVLRSDQRRSPRIVRPSLIIAPGGDCSNDPSSCSVGSTYDGMPVIAVVSTSAGTGSLYSSGYGDYTNLSGYWNPGTAYYGPAYQTPHIDWACVTGALASTVSALTTIASNIVKSPAQYGEAAGWAAEWLKGGITAAEFAEVLLATLGAAEFIALAGAAAVAIASIGLLIYCSRE
jgi:hypothetical protein